MPRTREFNPNAVLDTAVELFWQKGYKACSMADVVKHSGVARYGLYQAFKDKDQLYYAALKRYHQRLMDFFVKPFCGQRAGFSTLVELFDRMLDQLENGERDGCFAHQAAIERGAKDEKVREIVNSIFSDTQRTYRTLIENGISDGQIRNLPVDDLVIFVMGIQRALLAMTKQRCELAERQNYVRCALNMLKTPDAPH